jgi:hypothetical protein
MPPIKSFFLGILAALFALFFELSFSLFFPIEKQAFFFARFSLFLIIASLCEEIIKYTMIYQTFSKLEKKWPIIFGGFVFGLGFSATEIFLNYYSKTDFINIPFYFILGMIFIHLFTSFFAANIVAKKQNIWFSTARVLILNSCVHISCNLVVEYLL